MQTLHFGNAMSSMIGFSLIGGIGVFLGFCAYLLLAYPSLRRSEFREFGSFRRTGLLLGGSITLIFLFIAYFSNWTRFYQADINHETLSLHYYFPNRTAVVKKSEIERITRGATSDRFNNNQLVIHTKDDKTYGSAGMNPHSFEENFTILTGKIFP